MSSKSKNLKLLVSAGLISVVSLIGNDAMAQKNVGIGTNTPNPNAILDIESNDGTQGLMIPRLSTDQRIALGNKLKPEDIGLIVFDNEGENIYYWSAELKWIPTNLNAVVRLNDNNELELIGGAKVSLQRFQDGIDSKADSVTVYKAIDNAKISDVTIADNELTITEGDNVFKQSVDGSITNELIVKGELVANELDNTTDLVIYENQNELDETKLTKTTIDVTSLTKDEQDLADVLAKGNNADNKQIINLANPVNNQDAVTKIYVDDKVNAIDNDITDLGDRVTVNEGDITTNTTNITNNKTAIDNHVTADKDLDSENELITDFSATDEKLIITEAGKNHSVNLSDLGSDDQAISYDPATQIITLEDGGTINLSALVSSDDQAISYDPATQIITLEDGGTINLSALVDSDDQTVDLFEKTANGKIQISLYGDEEAPKELDLISADKILVGTASGTTEKGFDATQFDISGNAVQLKSAGNGTIQKVLTSNTDGTITWEEALNLITPSTVNNQVLKTVNGAVAWAADEKGGAGADRTTKSTGIFKSEILHNKYGVTIFAANQEGNYRQNWTLHNDHKITNTKPNGSDGATVVTKYGNLEYAAGNYRFNRFGYIRFSDKGTIHMYAHNGVNISSGPNGIRLNGSTIYKNGLFWGSSDRRLKDNINTLTSALSNVMKLRGVSYLWKESHESDFGVIAQEIEKVYPSLVKTNEETGFKQVHYTALIPVLIEAIKEQQQIIEGLKSDNAEASVQFEEVKTQNESLLKDIELIKQHLQITSK